MTVSDEKLANLMESLVERKSQNAVDVKDYIQKHNIPEELKKLFKKILPYTDVSLHFSLKHTPLSRVNEIFLVYLLNNPTNIDNSATTLHHCFLTRKEVEEKGFPTNVVEWLESITEDITTVISYSKGMDNVEESRTEMMGQMKKGFKPLCIFIGDILDGVETEYEMAKDLGIPTLEL